MEHLDARDLVYIPADQGSCPVCGGNLFAVVRTYFAGSGEPIKNGIHVGCVDCDVEVGGLLQNFIREWVCSNYRDKP